MDNKKKIPVWLFMVVAISVLNGIVTGLHFLLIFLDLIPIKGKLASVMEIAVGDVVVSVIPSFIAAYGLMKMKLWGWLLSFVVAGSYLHGQFVLLGRFFLNDQLGSMSFVSGYFIVFNITMSLFLWEYRKEFFELPVS